MTHLEAVNLSCMRNQKTIFSHLSFKINEGQLLCIEGPNGCGKSSLLRVLTGLLTPTQGEILWDNYAIDKSEANYKQEIHYLSHANGLKLTLTGQENIRWMSNLLHCTPISPLPILKKLQLASYMDYPVKYLSQGQRRKLALAKLFLFPKKVWLLDEPLTALDICSQDIFLTLLTTHIKEKGLAVITTHEPLALSDIFIHRLNLNL